MLCPLRTVKLKKSISYLIQYRNKQYRSLVAVPCFASPFVVHAMAFILSDPVRKYCRRSSCVQVTRHTAITDSSHSEIKPYLGSPVLNADSASSGRTLKNSWVAQFTPARTRGVASPVYQVASSFCLCPENLLRIESKFPISPPNSFENASS